MSPTYVSRLPIPPTVVLHYVVILSVLTISTNINVIRIFPSLPNSVAYQSSALFVSESTVHLVNQSKG